MFQFIRRTDGFFKRLMITGQLIPMVALDFDPFPNS